MKRSINLSNVKAILFDYGGTLDNDGIPWKDRFYPIYAAHGFSWSFEEFEKLFYAADDYLTEKKFKSMNYREMLLKQVGLIFRFAGVKDPALQKKIALEFERDSFKTLRRNRPLLSKLRKRYQLGIVSNFYGNLPTLCREIGYTPLFSAIIDSAREGVTKPDPEIFMAALDRLKVRPREAVFVGDSPHRDIAGAKGVGMQRVWLNTFNPKRKPLYKDDVAIQSLTQLERILLP